MVTVYATNNAYDTILVLRDDCTVRAAYPVAAQNHSAVAALLSGQIPEDATAMDQDNVDHHRDPSDWGTILSPEAAAERIHELFGADNGELPAEHTFGASNDQIRQLRLEAAEAGDCGMVVFCDMALDGDEVGLMRVVKAIEDAKAIDVDAVTSAVYVTNGGSDTILLLNTDHRVVGAYRVALCTPDEAALALRGECLNVPALNAEGCPQVSDWGTKVTGEKLRDRLEFYFGVTEARRVLASITTNS